MLESVAVDHPKPYSDTDPRAMEVWLDLLRQKTPGERLTSMLQLTEFTLQLSEMGVRKLYPDANEEEVRLHVAARHLPRDVMIRVYGWDPELHAYTR